MSDIVNAYADGYNQAYKHASAVGSSLKPEMPDTSYSRYLASGNSGIFAQFLGSLFGGYNNWANSELAKYQNAYSEWQQEQTNMYNSPEHQMELLSQAGINPFYYTSQNTSSAQSPISAQAPSISDVGQNSLSGIISFISIASKLLALRQQGAALDKQQLDNQLLRGSLNDMLSNRKWNSQNTFLKYQTGLQTAYKNDWLYGTQILPNSFDIASSVANSPFGSRYSMENVGINLMNELRSSQKVLNNLSAKKQREVLEKILPLEIDLLTGKKELQDVDVEFRKMEKEFTLGNKALAPLLSFLSHIITKRF